MLADTPRTFTRQVLLAMADLAMMGGLLYLCYLCAPTPPPNREDLHVQILGLLAPVALMFHLGGAYVGTNQTTPGMWIRHAWLSFWAAVGLFFAAAYVLKIGAFYPRAVIGPWLVSVSLGMAVVRWLMFYDMERRHRHGRGLERTLLAGSLSMCQAFSRHADANPVLGIKVVGMCSDGLLSVGEGKELVVGDYERLEAMVAELEIDRVMVCGNFDDQKLVVNIMNRLLNYPVTVQYVPDMSQFPVFSLRVGDYAGQPVINLSSSPLTERALFIKWLEDKVIGGLILLLIAPLLAAIACAVRFTSPGPVLFIQDRHGLGGARIRVMKFRTMFHNTAPQPVSAGALEPRGQPAAPEHHTTVD
nr:sugar transferase [Planctomycetota bacterium]